MSPDTPTGALEGLQVVELASEHAALAGKMLGDLGADVIVVEPPGGHASRAYGPFADDVDDPERSLWWWYYNTSKRGVVLDLTTADGVGAVPAVWWPTPTSCSRVRRRARWPRSGSTTPRCGPAHERLIWVSVTPFGSEGTRGDEPATDLTLLAGGGPAWSCGYDDHTLPPVRGGGNQAFHIGSTWAVMGALTAVLARDVTGRGQHVDVSMHAACNVTTEMGTYGYLAGRETVLRQTGRHAMPTISMPTQMRCADGVYVTTGFPPRSQRDFESLLDWIETLGFRDEFPETMLLDLAIERGGVSIAEMATDDLARDIFGAGREALNFIAERIPRRTLHRWPDARPRVRRRGVARGGVRDRAHQGARVPGRGGPRGARPHRPLSGGAVPDAASPWSISRRAPAGRRADRRRGPHRALSSSSIRWFNRAWSAMWT